MPSGNSLISLCNTVLIQLADLGRHTTFCPKHRAGRAIFVRNGVDNRPREVTDV
jgi:hypothetical protein